MWDASAQECGPKKNLSMEYSGTRGDGAATMRRLRRGIMRTFTPFPFLRAVKVRQVFGEERLYRVGAVGFDSWFCKGWVKVAGKRNCRCTGWPCASASERAMHPSTLRALGPC